MEINIEQITQVLNAAEYEIRQLRRKNEVLSAQVLVVNAFAHALKSPVPSEGAYVDVVWEITELKKSLVENK